jgi:hypothetical protein
MALLFLTGPREQPISHVPDMGDGLLPGGNLDSEPQSSGEVQNARSFTSTAKRAAHFLRGNVQQEDSEPQSRGEVQNIWSFTSAVTS